MVVFVMFNYISKRLMYVFFEGEIYLIRIENGCLVLKVLVSKFYVW